MASTVLTAGAGLAGAATLAVLGLGLYFKAGEDRVTALRAQRLNRRSSKPRSVEPSSPAYVRPRELWRVEELAQFDGSASEDSPILLAADGIVFNVARARQLYGPGGEYSVMAGRDASRFLAANSVDEAEAGEDAPLSLAGRASLSAWVFSLKQKYDEVGRCARPRSASRRPSRANRAHCHPCGLQPRTDRARHARGAASHRRPRRWRRSTRPRPSARPTPGPWTA